MSYMSNFRTCLDNQPEVYGQAFADSGVLGIHTVERLLAIEPGWVKFIHGGNPQLNRRVWETFDWLLGHGYTLRPDPDLEHWGDARVFMDCFEVGRIRVGNPPRLVASVHCPATPAAWEILGRLGVRHREVTPAGGTLNISLDRPVSGRSIGRLMEGLAELRPVSEQHAEAERARVEQEVAEERAALLPTLRRAGLGVPDLPAELLSRLVTVEPWYWTTDPDLTSPMSEYLMEDEKWLRSAVPDQFVVTHSGHGINSYALTVRWAMGPLALHAQLHWGGTSDLSDPADAAARATRFLHHVTRLVRAVAPTGWSSEERCRDLVVRYSAIRHIHEFRVWDPARREWHEATGEETGEVFEAVRWLLGVGERI